MVILVEMLQDISNLWMFRIQRSKYKVANKAHWQAVSQSSSGYNWCSKCPPCSWVHVQRRSVSSWCIFLA